MRLCLQFLYFYRLLGNIMATTGVAYLTSKEGIVKAAAVMLGCITFALVIESGYSRVIVVLAVYILCWVLSTLSYIFFITNLEEKLPKAISYEVNICFVYLSENIVRKL